MRKFSFFRRRNPEDDPYLLFFKNVLGFTPRHMEIYHAAFTHRSVAQNDGHHVNYERLEYLGDAVLDLIVAEYLYKKYPYEGEGFLTISRSKLVSRASLGKLAHKIGLIDLVQYNKSQSGSFKSLEGDVFEALVGAIYLERGYDFTRNLVINRLFATHVDVDGLIQSEENYKGLILNWGQQHHRSVTFNIVRTNVQGHNSHREYKCCVHIDGQPACSAVAGSIKVAEQLAAEKSYKQFVENAGTQQVASLPSDPQPEGSADAPKSE